MKVLRWIDDHLEEVLLIIFSVTMVVAIALQVFMRHVMNSSLSWSEELARYCFIWLVYIGISYGVKKQRHIKVDVMLVLLKDKAKIVLNIVSNIIFLGFAIFVVIYGYDISKQLLGFGQTSPALHIPMGIVYLATPVGMGLTAIRIIQQLIKQFKALLGNEEFQVKTEQEVILENKEIQDQIEATENKKD
ncbi:TRAP transporter permease DctQ [Salipaludibacillus neizhouensis]|uniref:TRAP transporter permease DctQ n=1 Tax=Salipaludibacillus neizhouensis TaxID=885475 RepID=A0A3A9K3W6_9BACI|nr:TRAP transporter small permease [Salipaludibacillus neizhouensis]RKL65570.1 TRAP transporter permease DctQ [Salipaludibacillus neizhouensis]